MTIAGKFCFQTPEVLFRDINDKGDEVAVSDNHQALGAKSDMCPLHRGHEANAIPSISSIFRGTT